MMASAIDVGGFHHLALTVANVQQARQFYTEVLGFEVAGEFGPRVLLSNGQMFFAIGPAAGQALPNDRFDENRVGLDHLSFGVRDRAALAQAVRVLDERGIPHGDITELGGLGIVVLTFRDPDNIQLELTAPAG